MFFGFRQVPDKFCQVVIEPASNLIHHLDLRHNCQRIFAMDIRIQRLTGWTAGCAPPSQQQVRHIGAGEAYNLCMNRRIKLVLLAAIGLFGGAVFQQFSPWRIYAQNQTPAPIQTQTPGPNAYVDLRAERMDHPEGPLVHLKGHAEIRTQAVIVRADEADFNQDTLEVEARGDVHIRLLKAK
jgi:hypothetical protein